jgi:tetratricopeptide (TPR) repeat protein
VLLQIEPSGTERLYQEVQAISFTEPFGELGHALHDMTRTAILSHLNAAQSDLFKTYSQRAYEYFQQFDDPQNVVEAVYHLLATDKAAGMKLFRKQMRIYRQERNFSATDNLLRNARELVELGLLADTKAAEIEREEYYTGLEFARRGERVRIPDKARDYLTQAIRIFKPVEDISRYKELEPDLLRDTVKEFRQGFLMQKLDKAKQLGDILRQSIWLTELGFIDSEEKDHETALNRYNEVLALDENDKETIPGVEELTGKWAGTQRHWQILTVHFHWMRTIFGHLFIEQ